jgi:hypothetical protein
MFKTYWEVVMVDGGDYQVYVKLLEVDGQSCAMLEALNKCHDMAPNSIHKLTVHWLGYDRGEIKRYLTYSADGNKQYFTYARSEVEAGNHFRGLNLVLWNGPPPNLVIQEVPDA